MEGECLYGHDDHTLLSGYRRIRARKTHKKVGKTKWWKSVDNTSEA